MVSPTGNVSSKAQEGGILSDIAGAFGQVALGVGDTASMLYHFPDDVVGYVGGRDRFMGERRDITKYFSDWPSDAGMFNPFSQKHPVTRAADTACMVTLGGADLMLGHVPNWILNDGLGLGIKYLASSPKSWRAIGADYSMAAAGLAAGRAAPALKAKMMPKAAVVEPTPAAIDLGAVADSVREFGMETLERGTMRALEKSGGILYATDDAAGAVDGKVKVGAANLTPADITRQIIEAARREDVENIYNTALAHPEWFNSSHIELLLSRSSDRAFYLIGDRVIAELGSARVDLARPAIDALYEVKEFGGITIREIVNRRLQAFVGNDVVKFVQKMKDANHWLRGEGWAETLASLLEKKPDLIDQSTAPAVLGEFIREGEREVSLFDADESGYIPRLDLQLKLSAAIPAYFHRALRFALKDVVRLSNWADPDNYNLGKRIDSIKDVLRNHPDHIDWFLGEVNSTLRAFDMIFPRIDSVHLEASIETVKGLRKEVGQLRGEVRAAKKAAAGKVAEEAETK